ncbi:MAG: peptidylprolyl isomerase [Bacteroidetes bacterium]|nr:peptidylprolyl isomerase [Bacteroidota bacterium]MBV6461107.1 FKBP-type peptidyl-prolyl cis-trans isomerase SlyD [Flavobacteriales bacterium]WKZ75494.1 MAG: peptidylprolyl isomerase [Vicingaceae bacterium]MCL4815062.1 peptidylprolyl isomerase [Flavobacteriales bacterium]NOG94831.1 peptidylprolyl isomerase [Bacteroidota bacterium]
MLIVKDKDTVKVHYTGRFINGEIFDSSEGREPLEFTLGQGMLIPGFEKAVIGMMANQSKTVTIPVEEAYGPVMEEMVQQVPREALPPDMEPHVGMQLMSQLPNGTEIPLVITALNETEITVDANHPLAGKELVFEIMLVSVVS